MICNTILDAIGNTPIIRLNRMVDENSAEILVKFEGLNVGGSIKTRTAYNMICDAEKKGLLYSLCGQFNKTAEYVKKNADGQSLLYKIFSFVEENFNTDCSLSSLANIIGYDYSYLSRYFKKTIGISFNSYVTNYRLSYACYLMENTEQSILQCAYNSGFASLRNFNRCFKESFNITPSHYRKNIRV